MKLRVIVLLACLQLIAASGASASALDRHHRHHEARIAHQYNSSHKNYQIADRYSSYAYNPSHRVADGRPTAWCGWEMRHLVGGDPGPEYNLARNWAHWGQRASGPAPGVIGVMAHHVFKVIQVLGPGTVLAISGNDSHAVRVRQRSTAGVIAWRAG
jgi:hypothetical protein